MPKQPTKYIVTDGELTLLLETAEEGGYLVTSPFDSDILTEADTLEEAFEMARDVVATYKAMRAQPKKQSGGSAKAGNRVSKPSRVKKTG